MNEWNNLREYINRRAWNTEVFENAARRVLPEWLAARDREREAAIVESIVSRIRAGFHAGSTGAALYGPDLVDSSLIIDAIRELQPDASRLLRVRELRAVRSELALWNNPYAPNRIDRRIQELDAEIAKLEAEGSDAK